MYLHGPFFPGQVDVVSVQAPGRCDGQQSVGQDRIHHVVPLIDEISDINRRSSCFYAKEQARAEKEGDRFVHDHLGLKTNQGMRREESLALFIYTL